jgi:hypothetical protein
MWDYIIAVLIGAAIPLIIQKIQSSEKSKFFELERKDKFRMAAVDKRLEAHQKAYAFCLHSLEVMFSSSEEEIQNVFEEGRKLMENHSLYLENGTREKMVEALGFLRAYCPKAKYISEFDPSERKNEIERFHKESQKVFDLATIIQKEVELEPIALNDNIVSEKITK